MFAPGCSSPMLLALLVLLSLANTEARDLDLLDGGVQTWLSPDRVARCPVHTKIQPVAADGGQGLSFVVKPVSGKRYSLVEKHVFASGLQGYDGLQFNFTTSGLGSWTLRLYDGQTNLRFVYVINKPDGAHSLTLPWSSFRAQSCRRWNGNANAHSLRPSSISHLEFKLPNGRQQAQLTLQGMHAMADLSAMALAAKVTSKDDTADGFDGPFVGMGITGHNDFGMMSVNSPAECAEACTKTAQCRSFDYGARGSVLGECWLSLADRNSVGQAYRSWELYNYYEIKATNATSNSDAEMALSQEDLAAVMGFFDGPFVGMGITGHNDFAPVSLSDPAECAEACTKTPECRSFDYGARGKVVGECWLSLANRESAGSAYESWDPYNYYEMKAAGDTAKKIASSLSTLPGSSASHAQRLSLKPMACLQAIGVLFILLAS